MLLNWGIFAEPIFMLIYTLSCAHYTWHPWVYYIECKLWIKNIFKTCISTGNNCMKLINNLSKRISLSRQTCERTLFEVVLSIVWRLIYSQHKFSSPACLKMSNKTRLSEVCNGTILPTQLLVSVAAAILRSCSWRISVVLCNIIIFTDRMCWFKTSRFNKYFSSQYVLLMSNTPWYCIEYYIGRGGAQILAI